MATHALEKPLKAYVVQDEERESGGVVFAKSNAQARREGASEFGDGDWDSVTCRRAAWADKYVDTGHVPTKAYLERGWWWGCNGCERRIEDGSDEFEDEQPGWTIDDVVEPTPGRPYHNQACYEADRKHEAERQHHQRRAIEAFRAKVLKRFPGVSFAGGDKGHAHASKTIEGRWRVKQIIVAFNFPGMKIGPAQLHYDEQDRRGGERAKPYFTCCAGDREAFENFASASLSDGARPS